MRTCSRTCMMSEIVASFLIPSFTCLAWASLAVSSINSSWIVNITLIRKPNGSFVKRFKLTNILSKSSFLIILILIIWLRCGRVTDKLENVSKCVRPIVRKVCGKHWPDKSEGIFPKISRLHHHGIDPISHQSVRSFFEQQYVLSFDLISVNLRYILLVIDWNNASLDGADEPEPCLFTHLHSSVKEDLKYGTGMGLLGLLVQVFLSLSFLIKEYASNLIKTRRCGLTQELNCLFNLLQH